MPIRALLPAPTPESDDETEMPSGDAPQFQGTEGNIDWQCSGCDVLFATGMTEGELGDVVFHCTNCGAYSQPPEPPAA